MMHRYPYMTYDAPIPLLSVLLHKQYVRFTYKPNALPYFLCLTYRPHFYHRWSLWTPDTSSIISPLPDYRE